MCTVNMCKLYRKFRLGSCVPPARYVMVKLGPIVRQLINPVCGWARGCVLCW